jgi:hypothetical protein
MSERVHLYNEALTNPACVSGGKIIVPAVLHFYKDSPVIQTVERFYRSSPRYCPGPGGEGSHRFYGDSQVSRAVAQYVKNLVNYRDMSRLIDVAAVDDTERNLAIEISAVAARETVLAAKETVLAAKETALAAKETALASKETAVTAKETAVTAKETAVTAKETAVTAKETALASKETALAAKETALAAKETALAAKETAVSAKRFAA